MVCRGAIVTENPAGDTTEPGDARGTDDAAGTVSPTATGEGIEGVPVLERDGTDTRGTVTMETSDVTAWCPYEGTADYYDVEISYRPDGHVVELMSLRDYFGSYRDEAIAHEEFAQGVFDHLTALLDPAWLRLVVDCPPRYGIETTIVHDTCEADARADPEVDAPTGDGSVGSTGSGNGDDGGRGDGGPDEGRRRE
jgi:7-cyano-7-deazaguanine reductase